MGKKRCGASWRDASLSIGRNSRTHLSANPRDASGVRDGTGQAFRVDRLKATMWKQWLLPAVLLALISGNLTRRPRIQTRTNYFLHLPLTRVMTVKSYEIDTRVTYLFKMLRYADEDLYAVKNQLLLWIYFIHHKVVFLYLFHQIFFFCIIFL